MTTKYREAGDLARDALLILDCPIGGLFLVQAECSVNVTTKIYDANAPFKFKVLFAWAIATINKTTNTWKLTDGSSDITDGIAVGGADKKVDIVATLDDAKYEIAKDGSLSAAPGATNTALATAELYAVCQRTA